MVRKWSSWFAKKRNSNAEATNISDATISPDATTNVPGNEVSFVLDDLEYASAPLSSFGFTSGLKKARGSEGTLSSKSHNSVLTGTSTVHPHAASDSSTVRPHAASDSSTVRPHAASDSSTVRPHAASDSFTAHPQAPPNSFTEHHQAPPNSFTEHPHAASDSSPGRYQAPPTVEHHRASPPAPTLRDRPLTTRSDKRSLENILAEWEKRQNVAFCHDSKAPSLQARKKLMKAAFNGDVETLQRHETMVKSDVRDWRGRTMAHYAARNGHVSVLKYLQQIKAGTDLPSYSTVYPVHVAATFGQIAVLEWYASNGADMDVTDENALTPLHHAAHASQRAAVLYLSQLAPRDAFGRRFPPPTPAPSAAVPPPVVVVQEVTERPATDRIPSSHRRQIFTAALQNDLRALEESGAEALRDARDKYGRNAAHYAAMGGHVSVLTWLQKSGCDIEARSYSGVTPAHLAAYRGHFGVLEWMMSQRCDVVARTDTQATPAHYAVAGGHYKVSQLLQMKSGGFTAADYVSQTPRDWMAVHKTFSQNGVLAPPPTEPVRKAKRLTFANEAEFVSPRVAHPPTVDATPKPKAVLSKNIKENEDGEKGEKNSKNEDEEEETEEEETEEEEEEEEETEEEEDESDNAD